MFNMFRRKPRAARTYYEYVPLPDITTYELSLCMGFLISLVTKEELPFHILPDNVQRHWKVVVK